jgi:3-hydroxyacyl-CoA dehydrogenase
MSDVLHYAVRDGIAVLTLDNPPVNGLGNALRAALMERLKQAEADAAVKAAVIIGSAKAFSGGADIREFNQPRVKPDLPDVNDQQDAMSKPLVAAIGGFALGGGLELALACHYRIALPRAQLGLPEVKLGILPGSGGTQRLPRLIPMAKAVEMMTTGNFIPAEQAKELGLVDEIAQGDLLESAVSFARRVTGKPFRRVRDLKAKLDGDPQAFFAKVREDVKKSSRGYPAPLVIVDCAEASLRPFDEGRKAERAGFTKLVDSPESKALRHMFFAERQTAKIPDVPEDTPTREIAKAAVIGAGTMGGGIAMSFANAGIPVTLVDVSQESLERGLQKIRSNYAATVSKGRLSQSDMDKRMGLIRGTVNLAQAADADIVIEAVFERIDVKKDMFRKLDGIVKQGAILATNTSTLDVDEIAAATTRPQEVARSTRRRSPAAPRPRSAAAACRGRPRRCRPGGTRGSAPPAAAPRATPSGSGSAGTGTAACRRSQARTGRTAR